jgi:hypothetical protein
MRHRNRPPATMAGLISVLYPDNGAIMFRRARVGGVLHAGAPHTAGGNTPATETEVDEWAGVVTTVGRFNGGQFGSLAS